MGKTQQSSQRVARTPGADDARSHAQANSFGAPAQMPSKRLRYYVAGLVCLLLSMGSWALVHVSSKSGVATSPATQTERYTNATGAPASNSSQTPGSAAAQSTQNLTAAAKAGLLELTSGSFVAALKPTTLTQNRSITLPDASGTICLDGNNCNFATQADLQATNAQLGQASAQLAQLRGQLGQIVIPTAPVATTLNGLAGAISIQGTTNQVSVTTVNGVISLAAPQDIAPISSPTFAGLLLTGNFAVNGTVTLPLDCTGNLNGGALTTNASGQIVCSDDDSSSGGGGAVTTPGGTAGTIAMFTAAQTIADSLISQALGTVTIGGNAAVTGSLSANALTLTTALSVPNGGTGANTFTSNGVLYGNGAGAIQTTTAGTSGQVLVANASGVPTFVSFSNDVSVTNTGAVIIANNAVTSAKIADGTITGTDIANNTVANSNLVNSSVTVTAGTGLSGGGSAALGGSTSLSVAYGSSAGTAVEGNTAISVAAGTNLTGGGSITLGAGGTVTLNVTNSPNFSGTLVAQGATITIGTNAQQGSLVLNDGSANTGTIQTAALGQNTVYTLPDPGAGGATICLAGSVSCGFSASSGGTGYIQNQSSVAQAADFWIGGSARVDTGLVASGAAIYLNDASNFATNINTSGSTGAVSIGSSVTGAISLHSGSASGISLATHNASGGVKVQSATNSTAAFQVLTSLGGDVFSVDTVSSRIGVHDASPQTALQLAATDILQIGRTTDSNYLQLTSNDVIFSRNGNAYLTNARLLSTTQRSISSLPSASPFSAKSSLNFS